MMLELVQQHREPAFGQVMAQLLGLLADLAEIACCMGKIQNAHGIGTMAIDEALQPVGPILHRRHRFGLIHASSTHLG